MTMWMKTGTDHVAAYTRPVNNNQTNEHMTKDIIKN